MGVCRKCCSDEIGRNQKKHQHNKRNIDLDCDREASRILNGQTIQNNPFVMMQRVETWPRNTVESKQPDPSARLEMVDSRTVFTNFQRPEFIGVETCRLLTTKFRTFRQVCSIGSVPRHFCVTVRNVLVGLFNCPFPDTDLMWRCPETWGKDVSPFCFPDGNRFEGNGFSSAIVFQRPADRN